METGIFKDLYATHKERFSSFDYGSFYFILKIEKFYYIYKNNNF